MSFMSFFLSLLCPFRRLLERKVGAVSIERTKRTRDEKDEKDIKDLGNIVAPIV